MNLFQKLTKQADSVGIWWGSYLLFTGFFSWLAERSAWLPDLGWADAILAGALLTAILMFLVGASLAGFRYFHPVAPIGKPTLPEETSRFLVSLSESVSHQDKRIEQASAMSESFLTSVQSRLNDIEVELAPPLQGLLGVQGEFRTKFDLLDAKIKISEDTACAYKDTLSDSITRLNKKIDSTNYQVRINYTILSKAIRARSAMDVLSEINAELTKSSSILLTANSKELRGLNEWDAEYHQWKNLIRKYDYYACRWFEDKVSLLPVDTADLENETAYPSSTEINLENRLVQYRTIFIVTSRYQNDYDQTTNNLAEIAGTLP